MKKIFLCFGIFLSIVAQSQEKKANVSFYGGFETNSQWYMNDKGMGTEHITPAVRSNNYLFANIKYKGWAAGIQVESYEDEALQGFNPGYDKTDVATWYLQYKNENIEVTAGYFYEQFGSGLIFRGWEDRALGINNSLRGARVVFAPASWFKLKGIYGRQRTGFDIADSDIYGIDTEFELSDIFKFETTELSVGFSYVGRDEMAKTIAEPNFKSLTTAFAGRINFAHEGFYSSVEYNVKSDDAVIETNGQIKNNFIKPGNALLLNLGYSKKGFGIDGTFRRMENMTFYSERIAKGNAYNDKIMNFIPSLTKFQHYQTANIYVYQAQPNVFLPENSLLKAGEIGGQVDIFYNFKKGTVWGGKYGTKLSLNASGWYALSGNFYLPKKDYDTDFIGFGKKYFADYNVEVTKKWNEKWQSVFSYVNQYYNAKLVESTFGLVKTNIVAAEGTYKFTPTRSMRLVGEHMWADTDRRNWVSATGEFNINSKFSIYASDLYNYGNEDADSQDHYYNFGGSFRKKSTRIGVNYGRQRGGLVCVGGVCRFVPESSGLSLSANIAF